MVGRTGGVTFRRNRTLRIGEIAVAVLEELGPLPCEVIAARINEARFPFHVHPRSLAQILRLTPGVSNVRLNRTTTLWELNEGRSPQLPSLTLIRIHQAIGKIPSPTGKVVGHSSSCSS